MVQVSVSVWLPLLLVLALVLTRSGEALGCDYCHNLTSLWKDVCADGSSCAPVQGPVEVVLDDSMGTLYFPSNARRNTSSCAQREQGAFICKGPLATEEKGHCCRVDPYTCEHSDCNTYNFTMRESNTNGTNPERRFLAYFSSSKNTSAEAPLHSQQPPSFSPACCPEKAGCKCKRKVGKKIVLFGGIGVGAAVVVILILAASVFLFRRRKTHLRKARRYSSDRAQILVDIPGVQPPKVFTFKELKAATKLFAESKLLGGGGFSTVYQGKLQDGRIVAVKKLNQGNKQGIQQFQNEVNILSKVRHPNLVQLLGFCLEGRDMLLVYEYVLNGTLADHLHGEKGDGLSMETRLSIALDTAHALAYLHFYVNPPIYHRDVKSSNILLDKDFKAKVADFGLSRLTHLDGSNISTAPQGTPGYLDPDYHESYQLTDKSDVYSFGVVLLELVSRKKAVDMTRERKEINLSSMALARIHSGALHELFDPDLSVKYWKLLTRLVEVAFRCLAPEKDDRPNMIEVVAELEQLSSMGVMSFSSRRKVRLEHQSSSGELKKQTSSNRKTENDSPTSVQIKWPSTHTSPNNSRSEV